MGLLSIGLYANPEGKLDFSSGEQIIIGLNFEKSTEDFLTGYCFSTIFI
jgi:hypothetical protein